MADVYLTVEEASKVINMNPQSIREQAHKEPSKLGFKVCVCGSRVVIPKKPFFDFWGIGGQNNG